MDIFIGLDFKSCFDLNTAEKVNLIKNSPTTDEVVTEEEVSLEVEQTTIKIKTREEYLKEKEAKKLALLEEKRLKKEALEAEKHLKKVQKKWVYP